MAFWTAFPAAVVAIGVTSKRATAAWTSLQKITDDKSGVPDSPSAAPSLVNGATISTLSSALHHARCNKVCISWLEDGH